MKIDITGLDEVKDLIRSLPERVLETAKTALRDASKNAARTVKDNTNSILNVRTGNLRRAVNWETSGASLNELKAGVFAASVVSGAEVIYAKIHEFGGTIKAKNKYTGVPGGPYLNIPLSANKTPAGVMRKNARDVFSEGGFIVKSKQGNYIVMLKGAPMFVLKKQVEIPPRLGMRDAVEAEIPGLLAALREIF